MAGHSAVTVTSMLFCKRIIFYYLATLSCFLEIKFSMRCDHIALPKGVKICFEGSYISSECGKTSKRSTSLFCMNAMYLSLTSFLIKLFGSKHPKHR